ncbi:aminoacyl-histidine dipeptidase [uncultured Sneathia sp.]|uniref:aminoacyl-histidine dipeptidase n=1 Tax=uncultured Sneathia sp. TaxID=278067 RepID=UPI00259BD9F0|nr:aminoacyl-histidine dipeptidase [uncultured Sneathia sp.]
MNIEKLYPERVFHYFLEISKIPRGSGNEKQVSDYLVDFAKKHNLFVYQDENNNVLIRKPATKGYEKYKSICIQGHMDMVCEKNKDVDFDFEKQGINVMVKDGFLTADGTTLGADNGISMGMTLAILESNEIKHPKLEILITTDEEVSMKGAENFDVTKLESEILVNIDSEEYGSIYVSSAGCSRVRTFLELENEEISLKDNIYEIEVKGLNGGHSGADIHENRANAIKILNEVIRRVSVMADVRYISIDCGSKNNTIPREGVAYIVADTSLEKVREYVSLAMDSLNYQYVKTDNNMCAVVEKKEYSGQKQLTEKATRKLLRYIEGYLTGVIRFSKEIEGLVQTSLNLGIIDTKEDGSKKIVTINSLVRSGVTYEQQELCKYLVNYGEKYDSKSVIDDSCNPWEYKKDSKIRDYFARIFEEQTGKKPKIAAIHAGLECGIFSEKNPKLDVISIGPDIKNPHTPDERMSIDAVKQTYEYLLKALEEYTID